MERKKNKPGRLTFSAVMVAVAFIAGCCFGGSEVGKGIFADIFVRPVFAQDVGEQEGAVTITHDVSISEGEVGEDGDVGEEEKEDNKVVGFLEAIKKNWDSSIDKMPSLFFTYWQHQSIIDAKNSHGKVRPPTESELRALEEDEDIKFDPDRRYVTLGGIVYKGENDWTIWLNDERVTPDAVPEEVLDLKVFKDYIEVKWLDDYTNSVYPLRLRAHQRFNLDMRIFLPG